MVRRALSYEASSPSSTSAENPPLSGTIVEVPGIGPLYWESASEPDLADILRARSHTAASGLWPLVVDGGGTRTVTIAGPTGVESQTEHWLGSGRPSDPSTIDPETWLADRWARLMAEEEAADYGPRSERLSAYAPDGSTWPGLAPVGTFSGDSNDAANAMTDYLLRNRWLKDPRLVLIPASSSSDALIAARCTMMEQDNLAGHAAVLRSWERRLGAQVIALNPETMFVSIAAAPQARPTANHLACEHVAFAPDGVTQNHHSFPEYVDELVGINLWTFWWD